MNETQREVLLDILENTESLYKIEIMFDKLSRDVTIQYDHMDDEWFKELVEAGKEGSA